MIPKGKGKRNSLFILSNEEDRPVSSSSSSEDEESRFIAPPQNFFFKSIPLIEENEEEEEGEENNQIDYFSIVNFHAPPLLEEKEEEEDESVDIVASSSTFSFQEEKEREEAEEDEMIFEHSTYHISSPPPSPPHLITSNVLEEVMKEYPTSVSIVFEMQKIQRWKKAFLCWKEIFWPTNVGILFKFEDPEKPFEIFEIRDGDEHVYMGGNRTPKGFELFGGTIWQDYENEVSPFIINLYDSCRKKSEKSKISFDIIDSYLSASPILGPFLSSWWRSFNRDYRKRNTISSYELVLSTIRDISPEFLHDFNIQSVNQFYIVFSEIQSSFQASSIPKRKEKEVNQFDNKLMIQ